MATFLNTENRLVFISPRLYNCLVNYCWSLSSLWQAVSWRKQTSTSLRSIFKVAVSFSAFIRSRLWQQWIIYGLITDLSSRVRIRLLPSLWHTNLLAVGKCNESHIVASDFLLQYDNVTYILYSWAYDTLCTKLDVSMVKYVLLQDYWMHNNNKVVLAKNHNATYWTKISWRQKILSGIFKIFLSLYSVHISCTVGSTRQILMAQFIR